uniref:Uncharacterized protein n=1 Tax=Anguilla anguilla TaxID=7936 RepID=A0A0E9SV35_ANGAN
MLVNRPSDRLTEGQTGLSHLHWRPLTPGFLVLCLTNQMCPS